MDWYLTALGKYAVFSGRSRRKEYWWFSLINVIVMVALIILDRAAFRGAPRGPLLTIYCLAIVVPHLAVFVRRLYDTGRTGWWWFLDLVPLVGQIVVLVFLFQDSQPGMNRYGPNPKMDTGLVVGWEG